MGERRFASVLVSSVRCEGLEVALVATHFPVCEQCVVARAVPGRDASSVGVRWRRVVGVRWPSAAEMWRICCACDAAARGVRCDTMQRSKGEAVLPSVLSFLLVPSLASTVGGRGKPDVPFNESERAETGNQKSEKRGVPEEERHQNRKKEGIYVLLGLWEGENRGGDWPSGKRGGDSFFLDSVSPASGMDPFLLLPLCLS